MVILLFIFLSMFFWASAAFFNAVMDTLSHHYWKSVFNDRKLDNNFWNPAVSSLIIRYVPCTKYKADAWHLSKSSMIVCQALSNCFIFLVGVSLLPSTSWWLLSIDFSVLIIIMGLIWNGIFNIFYNKILIKKQK